MNTTRREFLHTAGLGAAATVGLGLGLSSKAYGRILGANERVHVAVVGVHSRGGGLADTLARMEGVVVSHVCDVDSRALARCVAAVKKRTGETPKAVPEFGVLLEDPGVDAVVIATPDHWHAPMTFHALAAGKHVYVEKPCGHNPQEGEWLVTLQKRFGHVVQMGNQQRSSPESIEAIEAIRGGEIGEVHRAESWYANRRGGIGKGKKAAVPDWLDWELWQGPAPRTDYRDNLVHYNWHWFWRWGTGELCNNAAHELDICRWAMGVDFPERVTARGGRHFFKDDDWEFYDTILTSYEFAGGKTITWNGKSCNGLKRFDRGRGAVIFGTEGSVLVDRNGYELYDRGGKLKRKRTARERSDTMNLKGTGGSLTGFHLKNFFDAMAGKAAQTSPIDEGHRSVLLCHLGNIAWKMDRALRCDKANGRIQGDAEAAKMWRREYEPGWEPKHF
jgi:predicted dehydrogenase